VLRERIIGKVFDAIAAIPTFKTVERTLRNFSKVHPEEMPAAFFVCRSQDVSYTDPRLPPTYTFSMSLYLYVHRNGQELPAQALLFQALDRLDEALVEVTTADSSPAGDASIAQCRVVGNIEMDEGSLGDLAVAIVPIQVVAG
jgi:hypothetical protein